MSKEKQTVEKDFDAGKKIGIQFSKKLIISQTPTTIQRYNVETERYEPLLNEEGKEVQATLSRIKLPASSQYKGFIVETTENLFEPHRFDKDGKDLGANSKMFMFKVFENASYSIKRTPYLEADAEGKRKLDFANQEVVKLTGKELQDEMNSWMKFKDKEPSQLEAIKSKNPASKKSSPKKNQSLDITNDDLPF